jgi:hypothetical protein
MYLFKLAVLLGCLAMSSYGILVAWMGSMVVTTFGGWSPFLLAFFWFAAAIAHIHLSLAWLEGRRLGVKASAIAATLGSLGLLAFPAVLHLSDRLSHVQSAFLLLGYELYLVLPAFLLALYLNWYHASGGRVSPSASSNKHRRREA